jgi:transglutaminase-like putative cysteine protease
LPIYTHLVQVSQVIERVKDNPSIRYSLGQPSHFDQEVETYWRGVSDLSRVTGQGKRYSVLSSIAAAGPEQLRQAALADVPPEILVRYTTLPDSVPERVHALAAEIAAGPEGGRSAYDTAKDIELFLHQYPYSLEVELPPAASDPVDFFLFEQQAGYCDYYASSMVVLARSLGIPAWLATGYLVQPADQDGRQIIHQINAHSWAEVYFAGYGWVEFEPTAGFSTLSAPVVVNQPTSPGEQMPVEYEPPPIPERGQTWTALWWLPLPVALAMGGWYLWRRRRRKGSRSDEAQRIYSQLLQGARRLGQATPASQTPQEFERALLQRLGELEGKRLSRRLGPARLKAEVQQLTTAFAVRQYSQDKSTPGSAAENWRRMRWRYWLLGQLNRLTRRWSRN